jgi:hypothetical protein
MHSATFDPLLLASCEVAAASQPVGRLAYLLWLSSQELGWQQARSQVPVRSFWRYVRVLRAVGIEVPRDDVPPSPTSPLSGLLSMPGRRFRVLEQFDDCRPGRVGDDGLVSSVKLTKSGWEVLVMVEGDRTYTHVPLAEFLRSVAWCA